MEVSALSKLNGQIVRAELIFHFPDLLSRERLQAETETESVIPEHILEGVGEQVRHYLAEQIPGGGDTFVDVTVIGDPRKGESFATLVGVRPDSPAYEEQRRLAVELLQQRAQMQEVDVTEILAASLVDQYNTAAVCPKCGGREPNCKVQQAINAELARRAEQSAQPAGTADDTHNEDLIKGFDRLEAMINAAIDRGLKAQDVERARMLEINEHNTAQRIAEMLNKLEVEVDQPENSWERVWRKLNQLYVIRALTIVLTNIFNWIIWPVLWLVDRIIAGVGILAVGLIVAAIALPLSVVIWFVAFVLAFFVADMIEMDHTRSFFHRWICPLCQGVRVRQLWRWFYGGMSYANQNRSPRRFTLKAMHPVACAGFFFRRFMSLAPFPITFVWGLLVPEATYSNAPWWHWLVGRNAGSRVMFAISDSRFIAWWRAESNKPDPFWVEQARYNGVWGPGIALELIPDMELVLAVATEKATTSQIDEFIRLPKPWRHLMLKKLIRRDLMQPDAIGDIKPTNQGRWLADQLWA